MATTTTTARSRLVPSSLLLAASEAVVSWLCKGGALVDLRPQQEFAMAHLRGSTSIPFHQLHDRMHELPPRHTELGLVGSRQQVEEATATLKDIGYLINPAYCLTLPGDDDEEENNDEEEKVERASVTEWIEEGMKTKTLWLPSPLLGDMISRVEELLQQKDPAASSSSSSFWRAIDIACGGGRDVVFLAMRGRWKVSGVDYIQRHLDRLRLFARDHGVEDRLETLACQDIEKEGGEGESLLRSWKEQFDLVNVARYLHRPLMPVLGEMVKANGVLMYHTFMEGSERWGRPRSKKHLLEEGELAAMIRAWNEKEEEVRWEILLDEVRGISDGRPCSFFVAQKQKRHRR
ncbi:SAM-dependent methyltransferase [Balamuthia mandrillaris]